MGTRDRRGWTRTRPPACVMSVVSIPGFQPGRAGSSPATCSRPLRTHDTTTGKKIRMNRRSTTCVVVSYRSMGTSRDRSARRERRIRDALNSRYGEDPRVSASWQRRVSSTVVTVNRSPHGNKKHRDQFARRTGRDRRTRRVPTAQVGALLDRVNRTKPFGRVDVKVGDPVVPRLPVA